MGRKTILKSLVDIVVMLKAEADAGQGSRAYTGNLSDDEREELKQGYSFSRKTGKRLIREGAKFHPVTGEPVKFSQSGGPRNPNAPPPGQASQGTSSEGELSDKQQQRLNQLRGLGSTAAEIKEVEQLMRVQSMGKKKQDTPQQQPSGQGGSQESSSDEGFIDSKQQQRLNQLRGLEGMGHVGAGQTDKIAGYMRVGNIGKEPSSPAPTAQPTPSPTPSAQPQLSTPPVSPTPTVSPSPTPTPTPTTTPKPEPTAPPKVLPKYAKETFSKAFPGFPQF